jgi:uncharacterized protein YqfA (UPF0365 family)
MFDASTPFASLPVALPLAALTPQQMLLIAAIIVCLIIGLTLLAVFLNFGGMWIRAITSNARVSILELIGMKLRQVDAAMIVDAKIMAMQAGVGTDPETGITTRRLEAHYLAGGDVPRVINAIIAAQRADIDLDFDRAAAIDLAGRDVLEAVRTSVYPKVIDCPNPEKSAKTTLSAVARNGVELMVRARVTVRTNLAQLIGGATEDTIIARVGEGIITSIGSAADHLEVMENPDRISKAVLQRGLDAHTAFEIVSIDIADIDGDLTLDVRAGRGALAISTGSGDIQVEHQAGEVTAETGSGDVVLSDQQGSATMDTGSGDVSISRATGEKFFAKTGSGDVRLDEVRGSVEADTGSGDVNGSDLVLGRRVKADTGSGNVRLSGDFSQVDTAVLETGSGDVTLRLAAAPSARLVISTGSGDIRVDVPSMSVLRSRSSYFEGRIGGGSASLSIDTGSGDVAVTGP